MSGQSVRGAALWSMGAQYASFAITFVSSVLISRFFLGPDEFGLFSIALAAAMLVAVLQDFGITRYIAGEPELGEDKIRACFSVSVIVALGIGLVILALAAPMARFYEDPRLFPVMAVIAGSYCLVPFAIVPCALLQRAMDFRRLGIVTVAASLAGGGTALATAAAGESAMSLAWGTVAQQGVRALLGMALSGNRPTWPPTLKGVKPIIGFGSGMSALYVSGAIGTRTPDLIIGRLLGVAATGLYSRGSSIAAQLVTLLTGAVGAVFYPAFRADAGPGRGAGPALSARGVGLHVGDLAGHGLPRRRFAAGRAAAFRRDLGGGGAAARADRDFGILHHRAAPADGDPDPDGADAPAAAAEPPGHSDVGWFPAARRAVEPGSGGGLANRLRAWLVVPLRLAVPRPDRPVVARADRSSTGAACAWPGQHWCLCLPSTLRWPGPEEVGFLWLMGTAAAGSRVLAGMLFLVRHPGAARDPRLHRHLLPGLQRPRRRRRRIA
jgi:hypothetical protein